MILLRRAIVVTLFLLFVSVLGFAQNLNRTISGIVTNDLGIALKNAVVSIKGQQVQAVTDADGRYQIDAPADGTLTVTLEGHATQEIAIEGNREVNVVLEVEDIFSMSLEDLMNMSVSSSSFFTLKASETPGYIFTYDLKNNHTQHTLMDMVRMAMPGVTDGAHIDTEVLGVRGMKSVDNSKTMVMYDGQNLNQRANLGYSLGFSSKLLGDVRRVEMSLGPNAIVHGSGAISGYINMVPKNGFEDQGFFANVEKQFVGNAQNQKEAVSLAEFGYGNGTKDYNFYLYAGWHYTDGWQADSSLTMTVGSKQPGYSQYLEHNVGDTYRANIRLTANAKLKNTYVNLGYMQNYRSSFSSQAQHQHAYQRLFNGRVKHILEFNDKESLDLVFSTELTDLGKLTQTADYPDYYNAGGRESHLEGKVVFKTTRWDNNQLAAGILYGGRKMAAGRFYFGNSCDPMIGNNNFVFLADKGDQKGKIDYLWASGGMPNGEWKELAVFAEDIYKLNDNFVIAAGLRFDMFKIDDFDDTQKHLSPRVAASWSVNDNQILKASYQAGFRTADFYNYGQTKYIKTPQINYRLRDHGNKFENDTHSDIDINIKPEILNSIELNYHGDFAEKVFSLDVNAFANFYKNTIDFNSLGTWKGKENYDKNDPMKYYGEPTSAGLKALGAEVYRIFMFEYGNKKDSNFSAYSNSGDDIKIFGGELIATYKPFSDTNIKAIYSIAKSSNDEYADKSQCPTTQMKLSATQYLFTKSLMLNAVFAWEPKLEGNETNRGNYHDIYFSDRTLLDLAMSYTFNHVTLKGVVNNVLGENRPGITYKPSLSDNYPARTCMGANERQYWLSVAINF